MEKSRGRTTSTTGTSFTEVLKKAHNGDKKCIEEILNFFKEDIEQLARGIKMPKEDAVQALEAELISIIKMVKIE